MKSKFDNVVWVFDVDQLRASVRFFVDGCEYSTVIDTFVSNKDAAQSVIDELFPKYEKLIRDMSKEIDVESERGRIFRFSGITKVRTLN